MAWWKCDNCGEWNSLNHDSCTKCGSAYKESGVEHWKEVKKKQ